MEPVASSSFAKSVSSMQLRSGRVPSRYIFINDKNAYLIKRKTSNKIRTAKYTLVTFLPIFLFEQFRKWSNVFFLLIALLQQIPNLSPTGRYTTIIPLSFIMSVSAIKEIIEDIKRQRDDREVNNQLVSVIKKGTWTMQKWRSIKVGDIVRVRCDESFPADLVLLSSSDPEGICYIETSNLDGESNLKIRQSPISTKMLTDPKDLIELGGTVNAEPPTSLIYDFSGLLIQDKISEPLGPYQLLLRGTKLRNTAWIFGVVVYTGHETKLFLNFTKVPYKQSSVDKITNTLMVIMFVLFILICVLCTFFNYFYHKALKTHWYLELEDYSAIDVLYNISGFVILFHNVIPISLQVTLEVVRFIQAMFINVDLEMYHEESDIPASARTSNLNDELGQVKYVFADKTGTLTKNSLLLKHIAVASNTYSINSLANSKQPFPSEVHHLLLCMTICHTAIPERQSDGKIKYNAESTDERALVDAAALLGYIFQERTHDAIVVDVRGIRSVFQILCTLEFTSARKMMSVIARDNQGRIRMFCKGADDAIVEKASLSGNRNVHRLIKTVDKYAEEGLRTLCFAYKDVSTQEFDQWKILHDAAMNNLHRRSSDLAIVADQIEQNLTIMGVSGIEDELQDGVPNTIASLREAMINIWVLTGDKQQTAINIGYSSKLLEHSMKLIVMNLSSYRETRNALINCMQDLATDTWRGMDLALVIDGRTLGLVLSPRLKNEFIKLCLSCKVVICCRVSPIQKSEVVETIRKSTKAVTLAIGDGANDVAMIRKAHVGIGIPGTEGRLAAAASDYTIAQFSYLKRLLFVHGSWSYLRICKVILFYFYKNLIFSLVQLWFTITDEYSGENMFQEWLIELYNCVFTAAQPIVVGLFDRPCSADQMLARPISYAYSQNGKTFCVTRFGYWIFISLVQSLLLYYLTMGMVQHDTLWSTPSNINYHLLPGCFVYTYLVVVVSLQSGLITDSWTSFTQLAMWGSIGSWFVFITLHSFCWYIIPGSSGMIHICLMMFTSPYFWLGMFVVPIASLLPDTIVCIARHTFFCGFLDRLRISEVRRPTMRRGRFFNFLMCLGGEPEFKLRKSLT
ncbi:unnamed protein product [Acanthoscelides obtectus]|uniref:Phospholipid-transporting ATPase n=1 Tax=Acanthoscelides obtectus TaxID=200917 RepID=A0A9P0P5P3_ACAOB|nr:unnamed protein product [Acanthoscelides obtectus]CAK1635530.1 Probable phospholipid-transporting ATPase IA [Acanthoscelides obtectus]